jgi:hypothetical protein
VADKTPADPQQTAATAPSATLSTQLGRWLANPLLVTVVAALLVNWLIPQLTRKWQDHQKALEIKTGLVSEMSESVSSLVSTSRFLASGLIRQAAADPHAEQRAWNNGYRDWTTHSSSIAARLEAYLPPKTAAQWRTYTNIATDYLLLSTNVDENHPSPSRIAQTSEIYNYRHHLHPQPSQQNWLTLAHQHTGTPFQQAYATLAHALLNRRDQLIHQVLNAHINGF